MSPSFPENANLFPFPLKTIFLVPSQRVPATLSVFPPSFFLPPFLPKKAPRMSQDPFQTHPFSPPLRERASFPKTQDLFSKARGFLFCPVSPLLSRWIRGSYTRPLFIENEASRSLPLLREKKLSFSAASISYFTPFPAL